MEIVYERCCGLDIPKRTAVACRIVPCPEGTPAKAIRTCGTMTSARLAVADWLTEGDCTHVAMEATGVLWKPIENLLADQVSVLVVHAQHLKAVPGHQTAVKDADWIAALLRQGLLRASGLPERPPRALRELTRYRTTLVQERARAVKRLQQVLEGAHSQLAAVATDVVGQSGHAILAALAVAHSLLAQLYLLLTRPQEDDHDLGGQRTAPSGTGRPPSGGWCGGRRAWATRCRCSRLLLPPERFGAYVHSRGQGREEHLFSAATLAVLPKNRAEYLWLQPWGGKPGRLEGDNSTALVEAAQAAARTRDTYRAAQYRRLAARRGAKRAAVAVAHSLLVLVYALLTQEQQGYQDLGGQYFDHCNQQAVERRLVHRLEALGYTVSLAPTAPAA